MTRIQKKIPTKRNDYGRYLQQRGSGSIEPLITDLSCQIWPRAPVTRKSVDVDPLDFDRVRKTHMQQTIRRWNEVAIQMNQHFQQSACWMVRQIDDPFTARTPSTGREQPASAGQVCIIRYSPKLHQRGSGKNPMVDLFERFTNHGRA